MLSWKLAGLPQLNDHSMEDILLHLNNEIQGRREDVIISSEDFSRLQQPAIHKVRQIFRDYLESHPDGRNYSYLDHGQRISLLHSFADSNRQVAREYFSRETLFLEKITLTESERFTAGQEMLPYLLDLADRGGS
jgi:hypothetical protein